MPISLVIQLDIPWVPVIQLNFLTFSISYLLKHHTPNFLLSASPLSLWFLLMAPSSTQPPSQTRDLSFSPSSLLCSSHHQFTHFYLLSVTVIHLLISISVISALSYFLTVCGLSQANGSNGLPVSSLDSLRSVLVFLLKLVLNKPKITMYLPCLNLLNDLTWNARKSAHNMHMCV